MRCLIIDDEPAAREILRTYVTDTEELQLAGECKNALEARKVLKENEVDLLFLDINMPRLSGIDFLKTLNHPPKVILTTAYSDYALEGYELDVVDYLLKPFSFERFLKAIEKASRDRSEEDNETNSIVVKADGKLYRLAFDEIWFAESQGDYLSVHTEHKKVTFYETMKAFCKKLPDNRFVRIHRSYLVSLSKINYVEGNTIKIGEHTLPVGPSFKEEFLQKFS